jgi:hypothetical protein
MKHFEVNIISTIFLRYFYLGKSIDRKLISWRTQGVLEWIILLKTLPTGSKLLQKIFI